MQRQHDLVRLASVSSTRIQAPIYNLESPNHVQKFNPDKKMRKKPNRRLRKKLRQLKVGSKTLVVWETLKFGSDLALWNRKTGISQSRMIVALNVKILLRKLKRIQFVAMVAWNLWGPWLKAPTNTFKTCLCSLLLLQQMRRQASTGSFF